MSEISNCSNGTYCSVHCEVGYDNGGFKPQTIHHEEELGLTESCTWGRGTCRTSFLIREGEGLGLGRGREKEG